MKNMNKKNLYVLKKIVAFGITMLLATTIIMATQTQMGSTGERLVEWDVTLDFNEPGGKSDYVVFGEAADANDGPPADSYDEPKPPAPMPPYLRAWFDDDLPMPYHELGQDYRQYPDTVKVWDLYVRWRSTNSTPISVDISWDTSEFVGIEYDSIVLNRYNAFNDEWDFVADMLTDNSYAYTPVWFNEQWLIDHFQINATTNNPPNTPSGPDPVDGATGIDIDADLSWTGGDPDIGDTVTYDVCFGTSSPPPQVIVNQSGTSYDPGTMSFGTQYFWKIISWDNKSLSAEGPVWNFTTVTQPNNPPNTPHSPDPEDGSTGVDIDAVLGWIGGDPDVGDTVTYDVYFGTDPDPSLEAEDLTETFYDPGTLDYKITYYWKIIATDNHSASTQGPIWNFTTEEPPVEWECYLNFTEPDGEYDNVFFGEKTDASDGPDGYDVPKSPPGMTPYIRAWFDTGFPDPWDELWKEYKQYPDDYKVWNLTVQWIPSDMSSADITISWDISCLSTTEYLSVTLKDMGSGEAVNLLVEENYTFNASALTSYHFQIICSIEIHIADLQSKWNLISVPFNQSISKDNIIVRYDGVDYSWENATTDNNPTGGPIVLGYIYYWNTTVSQHYELSDVIEPGYGYWMYAFYECGLWTEYLGDTINDGYITDLVTTWNIMGVPNDVPLSKGDIIVRYDGVDYSWAAATSDNNPTGGPIVLGYIYYWSTSMPQHYELSDVFEPGYGYWMYAFYNCTLFYSTMMTSRFTSSSDGGDHGFLTERSRFDPLWDVRLEFIEPGDGYDNVFFGEASDALDGLDGYDVPRSPPGMAPYIRAWFDTGFPEPYDKLWKEYKQYPDDYKVWNLTVQWIPSDTSPTTVTIFWDTDKVDDSEYNSVILYDVENGTIVADMLNETHHVFTCPALMLQDFKIICSTNQFPITPSSPDPEDGATSVDIDADLSWTGGDPDPGDTVTYDVFFGTNSPPPKVVSNQSGTSYDPGVMSFGMQYFWQIVAWDNHGASSQGPIWDFATVLDDTIPPETTCELEGEIVDDIYVSDVTVTLEAIDDLSGVDYTKYKLDDGEYETYEDPFIVSEDGEHTVYFYSVDHAGNIEDEKSCTFTMEHSCYVEVEISGGLGAKAVIRNTGEEDISDLEWSIVLENGLVPFGREKTGVIENLPAGDEVMIRSFVFGIGRSMITVTAGCAEETVPGLLFLFFVIGL